MLLTITVKQNGFSILEHLSDIELYYTSPDLVRDDEIIIESDEFHHSVNVMRNKVGDLLFVTNGEGLLFKSEIVSIKKDQLISRIIEKKQYENKAENIWFCIPILKNPDRLKFAIEKCVELGITNFILFTSKHTVPKKINPTKSNKTALAAMKQSLRAFLPNILSSAFDDIIKLDGRKTLFHQNSNQIFDVNFEKDKPSYFLFGPEGGFDNDELKSVQESNHYSLSGNRLRSETAIIKCASFLNLL
jgi:16S rRNA (uracil1498-N3)-methyltransferase